MSWHVKWSLPVSVRGSKNFDAHCILIKFTKCTVKYQRKPSVGEFRVSVHVTDFLD